MSDVPTEAPTAVPVGDVVAFCDRLLEAGAFADYGPNGLQVPGPETVSTVVTGVSAHQALFRAAAAHGADLVLVHHGLFWRGGDLALDAVAAGRLKLLLANDMALAAYHLPLDGHPEIGNNALLAGALDADGVTPAFPHGGRTIGTIASFGGEGLSVPAFTERLAAAVGGRPPLHLPGGPALIRRVGIVSGSAADDVTAAAALGCDAFVTGEPAERATALAQELGVHVFAAGHHATETFGVRALGDLLARHFGIAHVWVDVPNPV